MNAIDPDTLGLVKQSLDHVGKRKMKALVIHNEGDNFSVGANLGLALFAANIAMWPMIEDLIGQGQAAYKAVKYAPFPVVGAPSGMALGGGCEILLHCAAVVAHAETYIGPGRGRRRPGARLGRLQGDAAAQSAGTQGPEGPDAADRRGLRDHLDGQGRRNRRPRRRS